MRLTLPTSPRSIAVALGLGVLICVLTPIWALQLATARVRTRRRTPESAEIPRVDIADTDLDSIMRSRTPVIITGLTDALDLDLFPDVDGLRTLASDAVRPFPVGIHRDHSPFFLYRGDYGAELERTDEMTLAEFVNFMFDGDRQPPGTCTYRLFGARGLDGRVGEIVDDIADELSGHTTAEPDRNASGLWIGSRGVVTPLHHDAWTGLLFQFEGAKRVRLFSPGDRVNLYFSSPWAPRDVWSRLPGRTSDTDPDEFPRFAHATPHDGRLEAGEVLFIPPFWSHEIEALEANISMPFRFRTSVREFLDPGFLIPAVEVFDSKFVRERTLQK